MGGGVEYNGFCHNEIEGCGDLDVLAVAFYEGDTDPLQSHSRASSPTRSLSPRGGFLLSPSGELVGGLPIRFHYGGIVGESVVERLAVGCFMELDVEGLWGLYQAVFGARDGNGTHPMSLPKGEILICGYPGSVRIKLPSLREGLGVGFYFP